MLKKLVILALIAAVGVAVYFLVIAVKPSPMAVYRRMLASAQIDYEDGFVEGFSLRSRKIVRALLRLTDAYGFERRNPLRIIDADDALSEDIQGDIALVTVTRNDSERQILFLRDPDDDKAWRVDLGEQERFVRLGLDGYLEVRARETEDR